MMIHGLDLNQIRILEVLLATGSVKETAIQMGMSQPAISRSLKALRAMFGDPLLLKTRSGMVLTKRAEQIAAALPEWMAATRDLQSLRLPASQGPKEARNE